MISGAALASSIYFAGIEFGIYAFAIYSLLYVIATCDNKMSVIPNGPVLVIGILGLVMACRGDVVTIEDALSIGIVTFVVLTLLARFFALGGGDIMLYSALSVVIGTESLWLYVLSGIFSSIIYLIKKKKVKIKSLSEKPLIQHGPAIAISGAILIFMVYM
jgi:prepilin signal peptidase PulO-like enzyme (type II secretory pathway)